MNLLIVCDKSDVKTYRSVIKTAPNTSVLGAVSKLTPDFLSVLPREYNPHAVLIDTSVLTKDVTVRDIVNSISQQYPYMKVLVLTDENDSNYYPSYCTVKGKISSLEIKKILEKMAAGADYNNNDLPVKHRTDIDVEGYSPTDKQNNKQPNNVFVSSMDKLSTTPFVKIRKKSLRFPQINPLYVAAFAVAFVLITVVAIIVVKSLNNGSDDVATLDEAVVTTAFIEETTVSETVEPTTVFEEIPTTIPAEITTVPTQSVTASKADDSQTSNTSENAKADDTNNSSSSNVNSSSYGSSSSGGSSGSNGGNETSQVSEVGGEPVISYDDSNYSNSKNNSVSSVKLSYSSKTMNVGDSLQLYATVSPSTANQSINWATSNSSVVSVSNGYIVAHKVGSATISATADNGVYASCSVTVNSKPETDDVHLSASEYNLKLNQTVSITLFGADNVSWELNNQVMTISSKSGNQITLLARRTGTAKLTAKNIATGKTYYCAIKVS